MHMAPMAPVGRSYVAEGHPWGPKAPSSRSERARPAGAEKMRARSARFFSYLKLGRFVCLFGVQQKMNKIRLDQLSWIGVLGG